MDLKDKYKPGTEVKNLRSDSVAIVQSLDLDTDTCSLGILGFGRIVDYDLSLMDRLWFPTGEEYKIPTIDEFVDGFVFEIYSEGSFEDSIEDFMGWYEYIIGKNNWRDIDELKEELEKGNIRVRV